MAKICSLLQTDKKIYKNFDFFLKP